MSRETFLTGFFIGADTMSSGDAFPPPSVLEQYSLFVTETCVGVRTCKRCYSGHSPER